MCWRRWSFYAALGFQEVPVNETWTHPYAVITDGRLFLVCINTLSTHRHLAMCMRGR